MELPWFEEDDMFPQSSSSLSESVSSLFSVPELLADFKFFVTVLGGELFSLPPELALSEKPFRGGFFSGDSEELLVAFTSSMFLKIICLVSLHCSSLQTTRPSDNRIPAFTSLLKFPDRLR